MSEDITSAAVSINCPRAQVKRDFTYQMKELKASSNL